MEIYLCKYRGVEIRVNVRDDRVITGFVYYGRHKFEQIDDATDKVKIAEIMNNIKINIDTVEDSYKNTMERIKEAAKEILHE